MSSPSRPDLRTEVLALLDDIKAEPHEDGLRLVLADWLEEYGDPLDQARSDLIRCQVAFDRLGPEIPQRAEYGRRARTLQQRHGTEWLGPLAGWVRTWTYQRGTLSVSLPVGQLRSQALAELAATETWAWVEEVYLSGATDGDLPRLRDCPLLQAISGLGFHHGDLGPAGAQALGRLPLLDRVVRLDLSHQGIGDRGLSALLESSCANRLEILELANAQLSPRAAEVLAQTENLPRLRHLVLWGNQLGDAGVTHLARGLHFPGLTTLDLRGNRISDGGAAALANAAGLSRLGDLNLADNQIGPAGAAALAASPFLEHLTRLVLWGNAVGPEGASRLGERFASRVHVASLPA